MLPTNIWYVSGRVHTYRLLMLSMSLFLLLLLKPPLLLLVLALFSSSFVIFFVFSTNFLVFADVAHFTSAIYEARVYPHQVSHQAIDRRRVTLPAHMSADA